MYLFSESICWNLIAQQENTNSQIHVDANIVTQNTNRDALEKQEKKECKKVSDKRSYTVYVKQSLNQPTAEDYLEKQW